MSDWIVNGETGLSIRTKLNNLKDDVDVILSGSTSSGFNGTSGTSGNNGTSGISGTSGTSSTGSGDGTSGTSGESGTSGTSGNNGTSGIDGTSGISGDDGTSGTSGYNGTSGTSGNDGNDGTSGTSGESATALPVSGETFNSILNFDKTKYYFDKVQDTSINFTSITGNTPLNVIYCKISIDNRYDLTFDTNFILYRNDITTDGVYDFWFVNMPNNTVLYSIVRIGNYSPPVDELPFDTDLLIRYNYDHLTLDEISGKVTILINEYNNSFNLLSTTDSTRPSLDIDNKRLLFSDTSVFENGSYNITTGNTWCVVFLVEPKSLEGSVAFTLMSTGTTRVFSPYSNIGQGYVNGVLFTINTNDNSAKIAAGVHKYIINQSESNVDFYVDDVLVRTQSSSNSGLTVSNILSVYNATRAQASKIKYFYDCLIYNRNLTTGELSVVSDFLDTKYPNTNYDNAPIISNLNLTNITNGQNLTSGSTVEFSYDVISGSTSAVNVFFVYGTTYSYSIQTTNLNSIVIPTALTNRSEYYLKIVALDQYGRASNLISNNTIKFNKI